LHVKCKRGMRISILTKNVVNCDTHFENSRSKHTTVEHLMESIMDRSISRG
jgi:hypothetical protein